MGTVASLHPDSPVIGAGSKEQPQISGLESKVDQTAKRYLALCAEFQRLSSAGYVPEEFYERFTAFTAEEAEVVSNVAYKSLTSDHSVQAHLAGQYVHFDVPGKENNCGLYSLAAGIVAANDPESLAATRSHIERLPNTPDKTTVLTGLEHCGPHLMRDRPFQDAFARVLRQIGESEVPNYMRDLGASRSEIRSLMPKRGEMSSAEFLLSLANILKMKKVAVWAVGTSGDVLQKSGCETSPDLIIQHRINHYTPVVRMKPQHHFDSPRAGA